MLARVHEQLVIVKVGGAVVCMVDYHAPAATVTPLAVDDRALVGGDHRGVRGYGIIRTPVTVVGVAGGAIEADHDAVLLSRREMMVRPRGDPWVRVGEGERKVAVSQRGLHRHDGHDG